MDGPFVQVGATRDGLDPYLDCARRAGMPAVLVETPGYLRWRELLGRRPFDIELPVERPHEPDQVRAALSAADIEPSLVLTGFERYARSGFAVAGDPFTPLDKLEQRDRMARHAPDVLQPAYGDPAAFGFPQVVKPLDGGGGLGVLRVWNADQRDRATAVLRDMENYGGGAFAGVLVEEYVAGVEYSLQCLAVDGDAVILSVCEKLVVSQPVADPLGSSGFREAGHIATHGVYATEEQQEFAESCLAATGYRRGPFHVDFIVTPRGLYFVEMGFRLSGGGLTDLVCRTAGVDWADLAFTGARPVMVPNLTVVGQVTITEADPPPVIGDRAEVRWFPAAPSAALQGLTADRSRHTGAKGRVTVWGEDAGEIRRTLADCLADCQEKDVPCAG